MESYINTNRGDVVEPTVPDYPTQWPHYPLQQSRLDLCLQGTQIDVFISENENQYIQIVRRNVPVRLLYYFCPGLRQPLQGESRTGTKKIVLLRHITLRAASWAINWMMQGGKLLDVIPSSLPCNASIMQKTDEALGRIRLFADLAIAGRLQDKLVGELPRLLAVKDDHAAQINPYFHRIIHWTYGTYWVNGNRWIREYLTAGIISNLVELDLAVSSIYPPQYGPAYLLFEADLKEALSSFHGRRTVIKLVQKVQERKPLSLNQIRFFYRYSAKGSEIRESITNGLVELVGKLSLNLEPYVEYFKENPQFGAEFYAAHSARVQLDRIILGEAVHQEWSKFLNLEEWPLNHNQPDRPLESVDRPTSNDVLESPTPCSECRLLMRSATVTRKRPAGDNMTAAVKRSLAVDTRTQTRLTLPTIHGSANDITAEATDTAVRLMDLSETPMAEKGIINAVSVKGSTTSTEIQATPAPVIERQADSMLLGPQASEVEVLRTEIKKLNARLDRFQSEVQAKSTQVLSRLRSSEKIWVRPEELAPSEMDSASPRAGSDEDRCKQM